MTSLTGQQKCRIHIMENVTLTRKEQARLQVLNSLLADQMTLDQAATLMGVTTRHTRRILAAYREEGAAAASLVEVEGQGSRARAAGHCSRSGQRRLTARTFEGLGLRCLDTEGDCRTTRLGTW